MILKQLPFVKSQNFKKKLFLAIGFFLAFYLKGQNAALEMAAGDGNPTTNAANVASTTTIRMRNNTDNPTGSTYATYANPTALNVTFTLNNQQYSQTNFAGYTGAVFIGYPGEPALTLMNAFGSTTSGTPFTSNGAPVGTGIDITTNRAINMFTNVQPLSAAARATNQRWQMADLVITFSRPVKNPYLQINALGGTSNGRPYTAEFDYVSSNVPVTFSKVSGSTLLNVTPTQILNSATTPDGATGNASRGTVLVSGTGITTLTLRVYTRGAAGNTGTNWHGTSGTAGEGYMLGVTAQESNLNVTKTVSNATPAAGSNVSFTVTASNNGASNEANAVVNDLLPSGYTYVSSTASAGTYNSGTGVWTIGGLNSGTNAVLSIVATVKSTGSYLNTATVSGDNMDPDSSDNSASATVTPVFTDTDGDGIDNSADLDDDNDGILDTVECNSSEKVTQGVFPTTGGNTNTVPGWTVGGTTSAAWPAATGKVNLNTNGLEFRRDQSTVTTLNQTLSGNLNGATITLSNLYWVKTFVSDNTTRFTMTVSYGGTVYATIDSTTGNTPIITPSNGASVNIFSLPSVVPAPVINNPIISSKTTLVITLPITGVVQNGALLFTFNAGSNAGEVRDMGMQSVSVVACADLDGDGTQDYMDLDSDGDTCYDSLEGDENVKLSQINANGSIPGAVDAQGVPVLVNSGGAADVGSDQGQGLGSSRNAAVNACLCYKPSITAGTVLNTNYGITALNRAGATNGNWPMVRKGAWTALEAKTKGFVMNRLSTSQITAIPAADLVEGMMVYNTDLDCLQINTNGTAAGWKCFNTQTCTDVN